MALSGEKKRLYQKQYMANKRKNKDSAKLSQKQALENAPESNMGVELTLNPANQPPVRPLLDIVRPVNVRPIMLDPVRPAIPPCPRGVNPNVWTMQQELKAGYQYKGRNKTNQSRQ